MNENGSSKTTEQTHQRPSPIARVRRWLKRIVATLLVLLAFYFLCALGGLMPVNSGFENAEEGIDVLVTSNGFHCDLWFPIANSEFDWRDFLPENSVSEGEFLATHIVIGWGDTDFYVATPTWKEFKISTALKALFLPTATVMHVDFRTVRSVDESMRWIRVSPGQYSKLVAFVSEHFARDSDDSLLPIPGSYGSRDGFFQANGKYHCFNTCNCWAGASLRATGVKTGWFTPLPGMPTFYLESPNENAKAVLTAAPAVLVR